nr:MAG TPA: hypothetical protein [Caudoviricetes sp.]
MYQEKKQNMNQNANENKKGADIRVERVELGDNAFDKLREIIGGVLIDSMIKKFEGDPDRLLGFLIHRVGNQEPVCGHEFDLANMYCDHHYYTFRFYGDNGKTEHIADHRELTVENLEDTVRKVLQHDQKTLRKIADEMADEDDED